MSIVVFVCTSSVYYYRILWDSCTQTNSSFCIRPSEVINCNMVAQSQSSGRNKCCYACLNLIILLRFQRFTNEWGNSMIESIKKYWIWLHIQQRVLGLLSEQLSVSFGIMTKNRIISLKQIITCNRRHQLFPQIVQIFAELPHAAIPLVKPHNQSFFFQLLCS